MLFYKKITFFLIKLLLYLKNSRELYKNTILIFQEKWDFNGWAISRLLFLIISWEIKYGVGSWDPQRWLWC
jgi:hypothetical protein